jgi:hypothetical protein
VYHAQHRAAAPPPRHDQSGRDYQPYIVPGAIPPPSKPSRPSRNHLVLRVVILAFIVQFPAWALTFVPPFGPVAVWAAAVASGVVLLGMAYGLGYGIYRVVRWALGV